MKVLYLVPPADSAQGISAFSFINEEIEVLIEQGVEAVIAAPENDAAWTGDFVKVPLPPRSMRGVMQALRVVAANLRDTFPLLVRFPRQMLHEARFEASVAELVVQHDVDLIHSHFAWPNGFGGILASRIAARPLVTSLRGMEIIVDEEINYGNRRDPFFAAAIRVLLRGAQHVTAVSQYILDQALEIGASAARSTVVLKGVHLEKFSGDRDRRVAREKLGLAETFTILAVGGLIPRKGMDQIIRAFAGLSEQGNLVICGTGPEQAALEQLAIERGVAERVRFAGQVARDVIPDYFAACDVFVLASRKEASGNVLCEALASGRPVITTHSGGPPEYITQDLTGFVVSPDDDGEMTQAMAQLLDNEELRHTMGAAARDEAEKRFAYQRMIDNILDVYRKTRRS